MFTRMKVFGRRVIPGLAQMCIDNPSYRMFPAYDIIYRHYIEKQSDIILFLTPIDLEHRVNIFS